MIGFISVLAAVALHELGHILAARLVGAPLVSLSLKPIGLSMRFDFSRVGYAAEMFVHAGGSIAGIACALTAALLPCGSLRIFSGLSLCFAALNLLPIESFDGGGILRALLSLFLMPDTVWRVCRVFSIVTLVLLWAAVLWAELRIGANLALLCFMCGVLVCAVREK